MSLFPTRWGGNLPSQSNQNPFSALHEEMNRLFDSFGGSFGGRFGLPAEHTSGWLAPRIDVAESDDAVQITAELPGVEESEVEITLVDDVLTIRGEKQSESTKEGEGKTYRLVERSYGSFRRSLPLPFKADPEKVVANFDKGVLSVTVPKPLEVEAKSHRIAIGKN